MLSVSVLSCPNPCHYTIKEGEIEAVFGYIILNPWLCLVLLSADFGNLSTGITMLPLIFCVSPISYGLV